MMNPDTANADGFPTYSIAEASKKADIVFLLLPDEVAPEIYERDICSQPASRRSTELCFWLQHHLWLHQARR